MVTTAADPMRRAARLFAVLADPTRLKVLAGLSGGEERSVGGIGERAGMGQTGLSFHLKRLRHGGLVACRKDGKYLRYSLTPLGARVGRLAGLMAVEVTE